MENKKRINIENFQNYLKENFEIQIETLEVIENMIDYMYSAMHNRYSNLIIATEIYKAIFCDSRFDLSIDEIIENLFNEI